MDAKPTRSYPTVHTPSLQGVPAGLWNAATAGPGKPHHIAHICSEHKNLPPLWSKALPTQAPALQPAAPRVQATNAEAVADSYFQFGGSFFDFCTHTSPEFARAARLHYTYYAYLLGPEVEHGARNSILSSQYRAVLPHSLTKTLCLSKSKLVQRDRHQD